MAAMHRTLAKASHDSGVLIAGAGVIGLSTAKAIAFLRPDLRVVVSAPELGVTSGVAGGLWMPFHCEPVADVARWSETTLEMYLKDMQSVDELVQMNRIVCLFNATTFESEPIPPWAHIAGGALNYRRGSIQELGLDTDRELGGSALFEKGYSHAHVFDAPIVDSPRYLARLADELQQEGVELFLGQQPFSSLDEISDAARRHGCSAAINCTGLGAGPLLDDPEVIPARGVLVQYPRPSNWRTAIMVDGPPLATDERPLYIIPRGDILVTGGSYLEGDTRLELEPSELEKLKATGKLLCPYLDEGAEVIRSVAGLRPVRGVGVRLEAHPEEVGGTFIAHNYGHGGSGWTVCAGCAGEVAGLLDSHPRSPVARAAKSRL